MQREQLQGLAIGAGLVALIIGVATGRLPRWLRVTVVLGLVILAAGAGFYAYRYYNYPRTLTVAAGSIDGVAPQLVSAISARLTATGAPVRLQVIDKGTALEASKAFSAGEVDLAVVKRRSRPGGCRGTHRRDTQGRTGKICEWQRGAGGNRRAGIGDAPTGALDCSASGRSHQRQFSDAGLPPNLYFRRSAGMKANDSFQLRDCHSAI